MLRITGARIYDPINGINGEVREICVQDGKVAASVPPEARQIDARGLVMMPGGVDMHTHIAGPAANLARRMTPGASRADPQPRTWLTRSGTGGCVPSSFAAGYRYARLGYTTVMDAAVPPLRARQAVDELEDTPVVDKGFFLLLGNNLLLYQLIQAGRHEEMRQALAWWLNATLAYSVKLANPGGVELWKRGNRNETKLDEVIDGFKLTPRQVIAALAEAANALELPHPIHLHCNNLGRGGNYQTTLETLQTLQGLRAHLCHLQFHCYGAASDGRPVSKTAEIAAYLDVHPELSADVGQVMFGPVMTMTADLPLSQWLHQLSGGKWATAEVEHETGCGCLPFAYRPGSAIHALQWGMGLELLLLSRDPWRMVLSTDHPNAGLFSSYPRLIRLLMDREFRNEQIRSANPAGLRQTVLLDNLEREYTLQDIAIITRAGPARLLGLAHKGHLGIGADADITLYAEQADKEAMFALPRYVIKAGQVVIEAGEFRATGTGQLLRVAPPFDPDIDRVLRPFFDDYYTVRFDNYGVAQAPAHRQPPRLSAATSEAE